VVTGEIGRTPAVYRSSNVLSGSDEDGAEDEEGDSVAVMKSINEVAVISRV